MLLREIGADGGAAAAAAALPDGGIRLRDVDERVKAQLFLLQQQDPQRVRVQHLRPTADQLLRPRAGEHLRRDDDVADARQAHDRQLRRLAPERQAQRLDLLRQGHVHRPEEAPVQRRDRALDQRRGPGDFQRQTAGLPDGCAAAQPRAEAHRRVAAELAAHHLQTHLSVRRCLHEAHLLRLRLQIQQERRQLRLQRPRNGRRHQHRNIFGRVSQQILNLHPRLSSQQVKFFSIISAFSRKFNAAHGKNPRKFPRRAAFVLAIRPALW